MDSTVARNMEQQTSRWATDMKYITTLVYSVFIAAQIVYLHSVVSVQVNSMFDHIATALNKYLR